MTLDPTIDDRNDLSPAYVDRRLVAASGLLLTAGFLVCMTGAVTGAAALAVAVRRYVADREEPPRETLRRRWVQLRSAGVAGIGAWQELSRQARLPSTLERVTTRIG